MTSQPDAELSRFTALLNELVGAAMVTGAKPDDKETAQEVTRLKAELKGIYPHWRDMSSAPKDGTRFLAAEEDDGWIIGVCMWCKTPHAPLYGFHFTDGDPEDWEISNPSRWMPIPEAPKP